MYYNPHETPKSMIRRRFDTLERGGKGGRLIFALGDDQSILVVGPGQGECFPLISYARMGGSLEDCWYGGTWGPHTHRGSHTHTGTATYTRGRPHTHGDDTHGDDTHGDGTDGDKAYGDRTHMHTRICGGLGYWIHG